MTDIKCFLSNVVFKIEMVCFYALETGFFNFEAIVNEVDFSKIETA